MPPRLTTQEFIDRARTIHGDKYGYAFSVYLGNRIKVMIHCREHGLFEQSPNSHISGHGCHDCADTKHTNESFIKKAREVHGNRYDYSLVKYNGNNSKVIIICQEHNVFEQTPHNHLTGQNCPVCTTKKRTNESFIEKAREIHGNRYDYPLVEYTGAHSKVTIICHEHGNFQQTPNSHLNGRGCPCCMSCGFDRTKDGFLYVLRSDCGQYMKIGITNNPERRNTELTRDTPFQFTRIELIEGAGEQIANLEKVLLAEYQPVEFDDHFNGYTEWVLWDDSIRHKLLVSKIQG